MIPSTSTAIQNRKLCQLEGHRSNACKHHNLLTIILWWLWSCWTGLLARFPDLILHLQTNVFAHCELSLPVLGQQLMLPPPETFTGGQSCGGGFQKFPLPGHCCHPQFKRQPITKTVFFFFSFLFPAAFRALAALDFSTQWLRLTTEHLESVAPKLGHKRVTYPDYTGTHGVQVHLSTSVQITPHLYGLWKLLT